MAEPPLTVGAFFQLLGYISWTLVFIVLIGQDMRNAFRKGAHWVPGHALILSALTIQVMNFVENQSTLIDQSLVNSPPPDGEIVKKNLFMIHTTRVMLCVLVAFFLPGMARPGYEEKWTKIAALGLSVFLDIFSELSAVHYRFGESGLYLVSYVFNSWPHAKKINEVSFLVSGAIITITLIWLILLLICAAIASKSIRNIATQKIPIILAEPADNTWKEVQAHVLKSLIVSRACYPESIIARSALTSSAQIGVTVCIICSVAGWIVQGPFVSVLPGPVSGFKCTMVILELIFILLGWVVISWRSLSSVAYYGRGRKKEEADPNEEEPDKEDRKNKERWSDSFRIEDFWTRHIVELQDAEDMKLRKLKVDERVSKMFVMKLRKLKADERVNKMIAKEKKESKSILSVSLQCVIRVLRFVVFISKVFWFLSELTFGNRYIRKAVSSIFSAHFKKVNKDFEEYKEILNNMDSVLWDQTRLDVFLTNRKSIHQANGIMTKGNKDGENCHALIPFLTVRTSEILKCDVGIQYLDPGTAQKNESLKFLWRVHPVTELDVGKYFKYSSKWSWKLRAVSLINVIAVVSSQDGTNCLQAYYEAWEIIDLVDESDQGNDSMLSKAADRLFTTLRKPVPDQRPAATKMEEADAAIKELAKNSKMDTENLLGKIVKGKDSMEDWEKAVAGNELYKLCESIDCSSGGDSKKLLDELQSTLADIIGACIKRVARTLVSSSRKWAQNLEERKLLEAVYIAGKSKGLMEQLGWKLQMEQPILQVASSSGESGWCSNMQGAVPQQREKY